jgi:predicted PurR-regulated permease PerM
MTSVDSAAGPPKAPKVMYWAVILAVVIGLLVAGRAFLIPLAVAVLLWGLLDALSGHLQRVGPAGHTMPRWLATTLSVMVMLLGVYLVYMILAGQAAALQIAAPVYQANFSRLTQGAMNFLGVEQLPAITELLGRLNIGSIFTWLGTALGATIANIVLVAIYIGFLMVEQRNLPTKLACLQTNPERASETRYLALHISHKVQRYMLIKTIVSVLTALVAYGILKLVGLDFAATWALIIFFLNYIPNIGSVIGVIFPSLLALVQFDTLTPFLLVVLGLGAAQFLIGNVLEPVFMGRSLNLSSFMILASLTFWGSIWGVPGMILSVPIMVIIAIVCSHIPAMHWVAILMSADGQLMGTEPDTPLA